MSLNIGNNNIRKLFLGHTPIQKVYKGSSLIWQSANPPVITAFTVSPRTIDLDSSLSGNISFVIGVTGVGPGPTSAHIVRLPDGGNVGPTFQARQGSNIRTSLPNIPQPLETTTYRLLASNNTGSTHQDRNVTVTKNPTLANLRRIGSVSRPGFTNYTFGFTLTGLPRPLVSYVFSGGQQGNIADSHFVKGNNPYTWTVSNWTITMPNANAQSLVLTATNTSGRITARLNNINN